MFCSDFFFIERPNKEIGKTEKKPTTWNFYLTWITLKIRRRVCKSADYVHKWLESAHNCDYINSFGDQWKLFFGVVGCDGRKNENSFWLKTERMKERNNYKWCLIKYVTIRLRSMEMYMKQNERNLKINNSEIYHRDEKWNI